MLDWLYDMAPQCSSCSSPSAAQSMSLLESRTDISLCVSFSDNVINAMTVFFVCVCVLDEMCVFDRQKHTHTVRSERLWIMFLFLFGIWPMLNHNNIRENGIGWWVATSGHASFKWQTLMVRPGVLMASTKSMDPFSESIMSFQSRRVRRDK